MDELLDSRVPHLVNHIKLRDRMRLRSDETDGMRLRSDRVQSKRGTAGHKDT